jgi:hypothetical protein
VESDMNLAESASELPTERMWKGRPVERRRVFRVYRLGGVAYEHGSCSPAAPLGPVAKSVSSVSTLNCARIATKCLCVANAPQCRI